MGSSKIPTTPEFKTKLKEVFNVDYETDEINEALVEILELKDRVIEEQVNEDEVYVFPEQFFEGT